jgi:predicted oxidoreductase
MYKDYDTLDLLIIKKDNAVRALKEVEEALIELKLTGKTYNVL